MKPFKSRLNFILMILLFAAAVFVVQPELTASDEAEAPEKAAAAEPKLPCVYYAEADFKQSVKAASPYNMEGRQVMGGIVSHHLLAGNLISSFFATVSGRNPEVVLLIGPNHKRVGQREINTGAWDWQTPYGVLETDRDIVSALVDGCNAGEDFDLLKEEHSMAALIPYIKYYMPEAKVVPILLHGSLSMENTRHLASKLAGAIEGRKWLAIGSVDFSHYLTPETADSMDEITLKAIKEGDLEEISHMGNDNLDSPPSVITLLELMNMEQVPDLEVLEHSNSARVAGVYSDSTTSYFSMVFYRQLH